MGSTIGGYAARWQYDYVVYFDKKRDVYHPYWVKSQIAGYTMRRYIWIWRYWDYSRAIAIEAVQSGSRASLERCEQIGSAIWIRNQYICSSGYGKFVSTHIQNSTFEKQFLWIRNRIKIDSIPNASLTSQMKYNLSYIPHNTHNVECWNTWHLTLTVHSQIYECTVNVLITFAVNCRRWCDGIFDVMY